MAVVLVTDGEQRAALAVVRSLGRAGHRVHVCASRARSLAGASRFCSRHAEVPDSLRDPRGFAAAVVALAEERGVEVLLPVSEPSTLALLPERHRMPGVRIPLPPLERFRQICDKVVVAEEARAVGLRIPEQVVIPDPERRSGAWDRLRFPLVVKPSRSVVESNGVRAKTSVIHAEDARRLAAALDGLPRSAYPLLVQERIVGPGVGIFVLIAGDEPVAAFSHRRLREKPPSGGVSVYRESIPCDPELLERSLALLRRFGWEGVAMVEYKIDARSGTPYLMEINGRFWGSLQLAVDAGVDFPRLLVEGRAASPSVSDYTIGIRSRWEWGEVDHLLARLLQSKGTLSLPPEASGRAGALLEVLTSLGPGNRNEILRASDPLPFLRESYEWLRRR